MFVIVYRVLRILIVSFLISAYTYGYYYPYLYRRGRRRRTYYINSPANYSSNDERTWNITAPQDKLIKIRFKVYRLSQPGDYVVIRDGQNANAPVLKNFSSEADGTGDSWFTSGGPNLWMKFKANSSGIDQEFSLKYRYEDKPKGNYQYKYVQLTSAHFILP